jgi:hypothetical protein
VVYSNEWKKVNLEIPHYSRFLKSKVMGQNITIDAKCSRPISALSEQ